MRKLLIGLTIILAAAVGDALMPAAADAQHGSFGGFHGHSVRAGSAMVGGGGQSQPFVRAPSVPHPPSVVRPPLRPSGPFGIGSAPVVYAPPVVYYDESPVYYLPSTYYDPGAAGLAVAVEPLPPPVQYPTGRYEMRGNGTTIPYVWVWVPEPPAAPPEAARPASLRSIPAPKIISIPAAAEVSTPSDPTAPKIINIPAPDAPTAKKR